MKPFDYDYIIKQIEYWQLLKKLWEEADIVFTKDSLDVAVFKSYLRLGSVNKVAKELNSIGYRTTNKYGEPIKLISNDITEIIVHNHIDNKDLENTVKSIQKNHKDFISKIS